MKILIVEDDINILNALREILENEGFKIISAKNGSVALDLFRTENPDFICLDIMMPKVNGYDVCRAIKNESSNTPIIFLSAKTEEIDRVVGLELGADDYIVKPFGAREVVARIRAVARRYMVTQSSGSERESFDMADLIVYPMKLMAQREGAAPIELSLREVEILKLFYEMQGQVIDRDVLLDRCWGEHIMPNSRTVDQHIANLRKRIEVDPKAPKIILTVHGAGYRFTQDH